MYREVYEETKNIDYFYTVPDNGISVRYYRGTDQHVLADTYDAWEPLFCNGFKWRCLDHLKFYLIALERGGQGSAIEDLLDLLDLSDHAVQVKLPRIGEQLDGPRSTLFATSASWWTADERLLSELRLLQRRWLDVKVFRDLCLRQHNQEYVIFGTCSNDSLWGIGLAKIMGVRKNQKVKFLPGRNLRGWLITFVTVLNKNIQKVLKEGADEGHQAFCYAWYVTHHFFLKRLENVHWMNALEYSPLLRGLQTMLLAFEEYHQIILGKEFWLQPQEGSFDPHIHGIKNLIACWKRRPDRTTKYRVNLSGQFLEKPQKLAQEKEPTQQKEHAQVHDSPYSPRPLSSSASSNASRDSRARRKRRLYRHRRSRGRHHRSSSSSNSGCSAGSRSRSPLLLPGQVRDHDTSSEATTVTPPSPTPATPGVNVPQALEKPWIKNGK